MPVEAVERKAVCDALTKVFHNPRLQRNLPETEQQPLAQRRSAPCLQYCGPRDRSTRSAKAARFHLRAGPDRPGLAADVLADHRQPRRVDAVPADFGRRAPPVPAVCRRADIANGGGS